MEEAKEKQMNDSQNEAQKEAQKEAQNEAQKEAQNEAQKEAQNESQNEAQNETKNVSQIEAQDNVPDIFLDKNHKLEAGEEDHRAKRLKLIFDIVLTAAFVAVVIYLTVVFGPRLTKLAAEPENFKEMLSSFGWKGVLIFMAMQIVQVVVAAIPGEFVQIAGGYIYGPWLGTLYSLTGIVLGSVIVFYIARFLGYRIVKLMVSKEHLDKLSFMMNSEKSEIGMFILFLIPGLPKDILTYIAGVTPVKAVNFFIVITLGRLPALFGSAYIGSSMQKGNYLVAIIVGVAAVILFVAGLLFKDKILVKIRKLI